MFFASSAHADNVFKTDDKGVAIIAPNGMAAAAFVSSPNAVNYSEFTSNASGTGVRWTPVGPEKDISISINPKGGGHVNFSSGGGIQVAIAHAENSINYLMLQGGPAGMGPTIYSNSFQQAEKDVGLNFGTNGVGVYSFWMNIRGAKYMALEISPSPDATDHLGFSPGKGSGKIYVSGSSPDSDLVLEPKGSGTVNFGTYTAGTCKIGGTINIKDHSGKIRKLAVCK